MLKLQEEIDFHMHNSDVDYETLSEMKYLDMFLKEVSSHVLFEHLISNKNLMIVIIFARCCECIRSPHLLLRVAVQNQLI